MATRKPDESITQFNMRQVRNEYFRQAIHALDQYINKYGEDLSSERVKGLQDATRIIGNMQDLT